MLLRRVAVLNQGFEPTNIGGRDGEQSSSAHRADSRRARIGNPIRDSNVRFDPLGQNPRGTVVYTPQRVTFLITKNNRARPKQLPPSDEEKIALFDTMFAYSGSYTVESDRVVHHVDLSWNEAWSGTDQVRFCKVDEQTLTYTSTPAKNPFDGREIVHEVTWERE